MKPKNALLVAVFPFILMGYGWYLGQLHQSMQDLAGILLFTTGSAGLVVGLLGYLGLKRFSWRSTWWGSVLFGIAGSLLVFAGLVVYARLRS